MNQNNKQQSNQNNNQYNQKRNLNHNPFIRRRGKSVGYRFRNNNNKNNQMRNNGIRRFNNNIRRNLNNNNQNVIKYNKPKNVIQKNFNQNNKNSEIRGKDLVISTNNLLVNQDSGIYCIIPINPLYWQGTRIKNMALQYQYYVPKNLSIEYVPTVSKFQPGTVTIGCISNQIINQETIQQTLISSTSGESFSCSEYFKKNIAINSLLQQKKLLLSSVFNKESVPFYMVVYLSGVIANDQLISPGSIYLNYDFEFFNPITETLVYKTENSVKIRDLDFGQQNISVLLLEQNGQYGVGTLIDVEMRNGIPIYKYNNSDIQLDLEKYVTAFYSSSPEALRQINKFDLSEFNYTNSEISISLSQGESLLIIDEQQETFICYIRISSSSLPVVENRYYKILSQNPQITEALQNVPFTLSQFGTSSTNAYLRGNFIQVEFINQHN